VEENPSLPLSSNMLGFCLLSSGDMDKAAAAYAKASDLDPQNRAFAHGAASAFARANGVERAMLYATRAAGLPSANAQDHFLVGKLLAKSGKAGEAVHEFSEAIALDPDMEEAYFLLARTYVQTGDSALATEWAAKLKDLKRK